MAKHVSDQEFLRYSAQIMLPEVGESGQLKLKNAKVLIVGMGGLGCPVSAYLAAAGVGNLVLMDDDKVELSNLQRQTIYQQHQLKQAKVSAAATALKQQNPFIRIDALAQRFINNADCHKLVAAADIVIDCTDNMPTRQLINRICVAEKTALIVGAGIGFDGQLISFDANQADSACYHCLYPFSEDESEGQQNCASLGVLGPVVAGIGSLQALEALKYIVGLELASFNRLIRFDAMSLRSQHLLIAKNPECHVCAQHKDKTDEIDR